MATLEEHLASRRFDLARHPNTVLDEVNRCVTFPLYNLSGQWVGFQEYRPDVLEKGQSNGGDRTTMRYHTVIPRSKTGMWGLETLTWPQSVCFVQEGVFDAAVFHNLGIPAVAILANNNLEAIKNLRSTGKRLMTVADSGKAGGVLYRALYRRGLWLGGEYPWGDVNDIPQAQFEEILDDIL